MSESPKSPFLTGFLEFGVRFVEKPELTPRSVGGRMPTRLIPVVAFNRQRIFLGRRPVCVQADKRCREAG